MTNELTKKITFCKKATNDMLTDKPVYTPLFATFGKIVFGGSGGFDGKKGIDIYKTIGQVEIRNTANVSDLALDRLFIYVNGQYYKVTSSFYESDKNKGYVKFSIESVI